MLVHRRDGASVAVYSSSYCSVSELTNNHISYLRMLGYCKIGRHGSCSGATFRLVDLRRRPVAKAAKGSVAALLMWPRGSVKRRTHTQRELSSIFIINSRELPISLTLELLNSFNQLNLHLANTNLPSNTSSFLLPHLLVLTKVVHSTHLRQLHA